ncbi:MAG: hypothetical protein AAF560_29295 [Acidobacteriota bacterium]
MKNALVLKLGFTALLTAVMLIGFTATSDAAHGPGSGCPRSCPNMLTGYTHIGSCTEELGHGCTLECQLWMNSSGSKCAASCGWH